MRLTGALAAAAGGALVLAAGFGGTANAEAVCSHDLRVLAQPRDGLTLLEKYKDEFKGLPGASFNIDYLNENDRRAKSRADASTVGKYNVYYIDEANVALFAKSNWVTPLLDYGSYSDICWYGPFPIAPLIQVGGSSLSPQASRARRQPR
jgi:multiple sugar transport system substrate-binding protein